MDQYEIMEVNLGKSEYIFFSFLKFKFYIFFKKRKIHNQSMSELAHYIIIFYTQGLGTCFGDTGILV